jgi:hypothetical protein
LKAIGPRSTFSIAAPRSTGIILKSLEYLTDLIIDTLSLKKLMKFKNTTCYSMTPKGKRWALMTFFR